QLNRWFETYAFRVGSMGSPQVAVLLTDISEYKRAEEEQRQLEAKLQHTQKLESLGVLAGGIAHDFNNLLTGILGYADLALLELPPDSKAHELISETVKSTQRAAELTNQMLAYSGKGQFVVEPLDLSLLIRDMVRLLDISISKNCILSLDLATRLPTIEADATQIRQVVMNLVINASEAIGEHSGTIRVATGSQFCDQMYLADADLDADLGPGTYVFVEVNDTGQGMSEETRARIFEPFYTTKFTGRGLGLSAVMGIVRGHRGALKLETAPGAGSTFRALFPTSERTLSTGDQRSHPAREWRGQGGVLVVDDEVMVRGLIQQMLERMGFTVFVAPDGPAAIAMLRANTGSIRLALLDMTMPHMNGAMTFQELRRIQPDLRVILMSGYNEQTAASQFTEQGIAAFIQKPFRIPTLRSLVR
ncbi:MAG TPA: response regulator, partial [Roseiflexaceae bacterium]|nr:response regulator [Roseiflexaceae bacterium]